MLLIIKNKKHVMHTCKFSCDAHKFSSPDVQPEYWCPPQWPTNQLFSMNSMIWNTLLDSLGKLSVPLLSPFSLPASSL